MLRTAKSLEKCKVRARDGAIGHLRDLYFEDQQWKVRYLIVEMGSWLNGREVLISPYAVVGRGGDGEDLTLDLTKEQIRNSPPTETDKPVSRQHEADLYQYYGWSPYWSGYSALGFGTISPDFAIGGFAGAFPPTSAPSTAREAPSEGATEARGNPHLRSMREISGYRIEAADGDIGHAEDFVIDDDNWDVRYIVVDTKNWWPGKKVLVSSRTTAGIRWADATVSISLAREDIRQSPEYDSGEPLSVEYTSRLDRYYTERTSLQQPLR